ncbi:MAG: Fe-S cluster assembly protein SufD [Vicinamibacterales bacterium]
MTQVAERDETYAARFEAARRAGGAEPEAVRAARTGAFDRFLSRGFPTTRDEEWRFTSVAALAALTPASPAVAEPARADVEPFLLPTPGAHHVVVVNGRFAPALSSIDGLPAGVTVRSLRDAWTSGAGLDLDAPVPAPPGATVFVDLNTAFVEDGVWIEIAPKAVVTEPLQVLFLTTAPGAVHVTPWLGITAGERSQAFVVESYAGLTADASFTDAVTRIAVAAGARLEHVKLMRESTSVFHLASTFIRADRGAVCTSRAITLGGRVARNDIHAELAGEGAEVTLDGVYVADGESLVDTHTTIDHAQPHCPSHEVYKGILGGRARAVFNGKIIVRQDAQKTDAKQTNKALLLSDDAQINTKPQLEIFADDVKCTHGAAIGQLDEDQLFYLRARGVSVADARNMLIHAFAGDVLDRIGDAAVRDEALRLIDRKLRLA